MDRCVRQGVFLNEKQGISSAPPGEHLPSAWECKARSQIFQLRIHTSKNPQWQPASVSKPQAALQPCEITSTTVRFIRGSDPPIPVVTRSSCRGTACSSRYTVTARYKAVRHERKAISGMNTQEELSELTTGSEASLSDYRKHWFLCSDKKLLDFSCSSGKAWLFKVHCWKLLELLEIPAILPRDTVGSTSKTDLMSVQQAHSVKQTSLCWVI